MDHFRILLESAYKKIKHSFVSIDIVKTEGVQILEQEGQQWIEFGALNLYELCADAEEIKSMLSNYNNYDDVKEQFIYDILAILEDLVYHISIFNIYFISALRFFSKGDKMGLGITQDEFANYLKTVDVYNISCTWKIYISDERKKAIIIHLCKLVFFICELCNRIKSNNQEAFDLLDQLHTFAMAIMLLQKDMNNHKYNT